MTLHNVDKSNPINWAHPLNRGLIFWWLDVPWSGWRGGLTLRNLCAKANGDLINFSLASWQGSHGGKGLTGSLDFDGVDDRVDVADSDVWHTGDKWTWIWRMRLDGIVSTVTAIMKGTWSTNWSYAFEWNNTNRINLFIALTTTDNGANLGQFILSKTAGRWYFFATVYDGAGATNADRLKLFVGSEADGYAERTLTFIGTINSSLIDSSHPLRFGEFVGLGRRLDGQIGEVRIQRVALSMGEVAAYCKLASQGYPGLLNRVQPYWTTEEEVAAAGHPAIRRLGGFPQARTSPAGVSGQRMW